MFAGNQLISVNSPTTMFSQKRLVILFSVFAAVRVAFYSAAFPPFNNVDELSHFDLVIKYSSADIPRKLETMSDSTARYITACGSVEYATADTTKIGKPKIHRELLNAKAKAEYDWSISFWTTHVNYESGLPPLYYVVSALWLQIGNFIGLDHAGPCFLPFWIRFMNVFFAIALVLIAHRAATISFPGNRMAAVGVPMLAAVFPQDTFYSIQSDVLSPVLFGITYLATSRMLISEIPSRKHSLVAGLCLALSTLVKTSNIPLFFLTITFVTAKWVSLFRNGAQSGSRPAILYFYLTAFLPVIAWSVRNFIYFGDLTASASKISHFHWTVKNPGEWLNTSLLTTHGICNFWTELMASFWRGELVWVAHRLTLPATDIFYWASSLLFLLIVFFVTPFSGKSVSAPVWKFTLWSFFSLVIFMFVLSLAFDFSGSPYPSFDRPYFVSGRLMSAALIPFLVLYVRGFGFLLYFVRNENLKIALLGVVCIMITASEWIVNKVVLNSPFNFFSLLS
jgi:hypothetical protein